MKNQYFGDVNDYRKYGLLRALCKPGGLTLGVTWMLTPDDGGTDGNFRRYLTEPRRWQHHDPQLFTHLSSVLSNGSDPAVSLIEGSRILEDSTFFSDIVPDDSWARGAWAGRMSEAMSGHDLVFLDPDNGFEVQSKPIGRKGSSKYAAWREVKTLWDAGSSVLVYQHYCRENRSAFTDRLANELTSRIGAVKVEAFSTAHVLFLLAVQPAHLSRLEAAIRSELPRWGGQIQTVGLLAD